MSSLEPCRKQTVLLPEREKKDVFLLQYPHLPIQLFPQHMTLWQDLYFPSKPNLQTTVPKGLDSFRSWSALWPIPTTCFRPVLRPPLCTILNLKQGFGQFNLFLAFFLPRWLFSLCCSCCGIEEWVLGKVVHPNTQCRCRPAPPSPE